MVYHIANPLAHCPTYSELGAWLNTEPDSDDPPGVLPPPTLLRTPSGRTYKAVGVPYETFVQTIEHDPLNPLFGIRHILQHESFWNR